MPASPRFVPGIIDYDGVSARYHSGRSLSESTAKTWSAVVARFVQGSTRSTILDLGAGTGRFTSLFASSLHAAVIGIEPSTSMLAIAARHEKPAGAAYVAGRAERIPLGDATCDLAWLSHVWHHIRDHQTCAHDLSRVVRRGGHVLVRGTFGDRLDGFPTMFHFWPAARAICEQLPTIEDTVRVFETSGFTLGEHRRIAQETAASLSEFARRTQFRADSALMLISDAEFNDGQTAIDLATAVERRPAPVLEIVELLVFRNGARGR
jgi:ubiquinone/menaquinone biosynthesis C-methylase UbiE